MRVGGHVGLPVGEHRTDAGDSRRLQIDDA